MQISMTEVATHTPRAHGVTAATASAATLLVDTSTSDVRVHRLTTSATPEGHVTDPTVPVPAPTGRDSRRRKLRVIHLLRTAERHQRGEDLWQLRLLLLFGFDAGIDWLRGERRG